jgi:hypothetical protein
MTPDVEIDLDLLKFKETVLDRVEANMADAGQYVVDQARRKLRAIEEPKWGAGYRRKIVADLLAFEASRQDDSLTLTIGVRTNDQGRHIGFYIEVGSSTAPAQPYLRPAIFENGLKILQLLMQQPTRETTE